MKKSFYIALLLFLMALSTAAFTQVKVIFDTDFGGDADDLGALAMLHRFIDTKECELLAITVWTQEKYAVAAIDAVNTFYNHPNIPIGVRKGNSFIQEWNYSRPIAQALSHDASQTTAPDALHLFRQLLSEAKDKSITIVTVGPLANILNLINSPADTFSTLNGKELIAAKVKEFVIMGGRFPKGDWEWNFNGNMPGVTQKVLQQINVPIVFTGYEIGNLIKTAEVFNQLPKDHPLHIGFMHFSKNAEWMKDNFKGEILDNATYDQTAVYMAVRGGYGKLWEKSKTGTCLADQEGGNKWESSPNGNHTYINLIASPENIAHEIEQIMLHQD